MFVSRWKRFQLQVERLPHEERYDSLSSSHARSLEIFHGSDEAPKHLFFFTRAGLCLNWKLEQRFPRSWHVLSRLGMPTESFLRTVRCYVADVELPLLFIGALNPIDLTIFAILRYGNPQFAERPETAIRVKYIGLDDRWLRLCRALIRPKFATGTIIRPMRPPEREHFALVREMVPDLETLVGPECFELLTSGHVFRFEAASNPGLYDDSFPGRLLTHLRRAAARASR